MTTETETRIAQLRAEAAQHGDDAQVELCNAALEGNAEALTACLAVAADAEAQKD